MDTELLFQIGLTDVPGIGPVQAKLLIEKLGNASAIFKASLKQLGLIEGIGDIRAKSIKDFAGFDIAEKEIDFCLKHHITPLFITDKNYPQRLLHCIDAPTLLYYRGNADLNAGKIISIIGTRSNTAYGKQITEQLIAELKSYNPTIVSGLAMGIDTIAHNAALQNKMSTVAVLPHGLNTIYPAQNKNLAKDILHSGVLLTEFRSNMFPDKFTFPRRNRIVAGMSDATITIETAIKGGSMITAELAYNYNRDLFAIPAKITDSKSSGCLKLIKQNKAILLTDAEQLAETMGWQENIKTRKKQQRELFINLSPEENIIIELIKEKDAIPIDELHLKSGLTGSSVASAILNLELQNLIVAMPGKVYKLL